MALLTKLLLASGSTTGTYGDMQVMARGYSARADVLRAEGRDLRELFSTSAVTSVL